MWNVINIGKNKRIKKNLVEKNLPLCKVFSFCKRLSKIGRINARTKKEGIFYYLLPIGLCFYLKIR